MSYKHKELKGMNKKTLFLIIFGVLAVVASVVISIVVDPASSKFTSSLVSFQTNNDAVYLDGLLQDDFLPKVEEAISANSENQDLSKKLTDYKEKLKVDIDKLSKIVTEKIDPEEKSNLIQEIEKATPDELKTKTQNALKGIAEMLPILKKIESEVPAELKEAFNSVVMEEVEIDGKTVNQSKFLKLKNLFDHTNKYTSSIGGKKAFKVILIILVALIAGIIFILMERKARASGEIKASEVL